MFFIPNLLRCWGQVLYSSDFTVYSPSKKSFGVDCAVEVVLGHNWYVQSEFVRKKKKHAARSVEKGELKSEGT